MKNTIGLFIIISISIGCKSNLNSQVGGALDNSKFADSSIVNQVILHYLQQNQDDSIVKVDSESFFQFLYYSKDEISGHSYNGGFYVSKIKENYLHGDIDGDKLDEIVCSVGIESGGNATWNDIIVFNSHNGKYKILTVVSSNKLTGCNEKFNEGGNFYPEKIDSGFIIGESVCWDEEDATCCPSLKYISKVKLDKGKLINFSKQLISVNKPKKEDLSPSTSELH